MAGGQLDTAVGQDAAGPCNGIGKLSGGDSCRLSRPNDDSQLATIPGLNEFDSQPVKLCYLTHSQLGTVHYLPWILLHP